MIISQNNIITISHATYAPALQSGASSFTVMQEDTKRSFDEEAPIEILAVELLSEEIKSNWTWDVWIGHAINYSQGRDYDEPAGSYDGFCQASRQPEKRDKEGEFPKRNGRRWGSLRHRPWEVGSAPTLTDHYLPLLARPYSRHGDGVKVTVCPSPQDSYPQQICKCPPRPHGLSVATTIEISGVAINREGSHFIIYSLSVTTKIEVFGVFTFIVSNGETQGGHF